MQAKEAVRTLGEGGHLGDRKRGGVAGEDGVFRADCVESGPEIFFRGKLLDDGFDDEVGVFQILEIGGSFQAAAGLVAIGGSESALIDEALKIFVDGLQALYRRAVRNFADRPDSPLAPRSARFPNPSGRSPRLLLFRCACDSS